MPFRAHPVFRIVLLVLPLASGCASTSRVSETPTHEPEQIFETHPLTTLDGETIRIAEEAAGQVAVVDLWATWCEGCEKTHRALERLTATYEKQDLFIVGVNVGESAEKVRDYIAKHDYHYEVYLDPEFGFAESLAISEIPALFVLDRSGRLVHRANQADQATLDAIANALRHPAP